jgi:hypothetical protein
MLLQFVRRTAGGNKMYFIEIESAVSSPRYGQMPIMYRIKGPAEDRDAAWMVFSSGAVSLRGGQCFSGFEMNSDVIVPPLWPSM